MFLCSFRLDIQGSAAGDITAGAVNVSLKAQLKTLATQCSDLSDVAINYYATELPDRLPTTLDSLVQLIEQFPSRLKNINDGKGIPIQVTVSFNTTLLESAPDIFIKN